MDDPNLAQEAISGAYTRLDTAYSSLDYQGFLSLLSREHQTVLPDERRMTRQELERSAFPFGGIRYRETVHSLLRVRFVPSGCSVFAESTSEIILGAKSCQEDLLLHDFWKPEDGEWKLARRIVMRQKRKGPEHFSLVEHPLYCQFGHCRTEKTTWKDPGK